MAIEGRDLLLHRNYQGAEEFLDRLVAQWPNELIGPFGFMALYQVRNLENFDFRFDPPYRPWEERGRKMAMKILRNPDADPWDLLLAGGTLGIAGFYRAHNSHWLTALRDGSMAIRAMEKGLKRDSGRVEALLGIGLYDYWRSYFTRKLRFLPFFPDRREAGREKILRAMKESPFASVLAEISLAFIAFQEKRYAETLEMTRSLLRRYPENTILRMLEGEALLANKRYPETVREFETLLSIDSTITKSHLFIGLAYAKEGKNPAKARESLRRYLDLEPKAPSHWRRPALEKLRELEKAAKPNQNRSVSLFPESDDHK